MHAEQQASLQAQRLAALQDQLEQANAQVLKLDLAVKHANSQQGSLKWQWDDLSRKLTICEGEVRELESKLSAAHMESAGEALAKTPPIARQEEQLELGGVMCNFCILGR